MRLVGRQGLGVTAVESSRLCLCAFVLLRAVTYVMRSQCVSIPYRNNMKSTALTSFIFVLCRTYLESYLLTGTLLNRFWHRLQK